jgi:phage-related protein
MREIIFYRTDSHRCPIEEFIDSLSGKQAQKVLWVLRLIEEFDSVPSQYLTKLVNTDDIWEVRVQLGNNAFRLLGFFDNDNLIILTNGFAKKTQKTPSQEIDLAEQRKRDYLNRKKSEENDE